MLIYNIVSVLHSVLDNHYATGKIMTGWHNWVLYGISDQVSGLLFDLSIFQKKIPEDSRKTVSIHYTKQTGL